MFPQVIFEQCQHILGADIMTANPIAGGDISHAFKLDTSKGCFFVKVNKETPAGQMFEVEALGLDLLASTATIKTPSVIGVGETSVGAFLLLEFVETGHRLEGFWEKFGISLAQLHRNTAPGFGLSHDNFIGSLFQSNCQHSTWHDFFLYERLLPQLEVAKHHNRLLYSDFQAFDVLLKRLPSIFPDEPASLIHGDLWSGNYLCDYHNQPVLIDPAVSYSNREMDLAMSRLFAGFDRQFYRSYEEAWPLAPGFEQRLCVYQLYYLLVHVNLFDGGYVGLLRSTLKQFI